MEKKRKNVRQMIWLSTALMLFFPAWVIAQCDIVAVVFDENICQADITFSNNRPETNPLSSDDLHEIENTRLSSKIRAISATHLLVKERYTPSEKEIGSFVASLENSEANHARYDKEIVAAIENLLNSHQYTDVNRKRLEDALATFRKSIEQSKRIEERNRLRDEEMRTRFGEDSVKELHIKLEQNRRRIAEQWVARWKMNKALYEKYGGRVIFQQAGIEPIDAYRAQLKDIREKGDLKILKSAYMDVFNDFEHYLNMGHNYLSGSGNEYFDRPYWETADPDDRLRQAIDEYSSIPHKMME